MDKKLEHTPETNKIVDNGIAAGKFNREWADILLNIGNDDRATKSIRLAVKSAKIDPDKLKGSIPNAIIPLVSKSWDELKQQPGDGTKQLREHAPEVYKAKFFEKNDRLPAERDGKPL